MAHQTLPNILLSNPFSDSAQSYLEEACTNLKHRIYELRDELSGKRLPRTLQSKLNDFNEKQQANLKRKPRTLCERSPWKEAGNADIITNLSSRPLRSDEREALAVSTLSEI